VASIHRRSAEGRAQPAVYPQAARVKFEILTTPRCCGVLVLVVSSPLVLRGGKHPVFTSAAAGEDGNFKIQGLLAGTYRVAAIESSAPRRLERSDMAMALLSAGKEVTLSEGPAESVSLELSAL